MKIVFYFDDFARAEKAAIPARVNRHHVTLVSAARFNPATDMEICDEVWIEGNHPKISAAYEAAGIKVQSPEEKPQEAPSPEPETVTMADAVGEVEIPASSPVRRGRPART